MLIALSSPPVNGQPSKPKDIQSGLFQPFLDAIRRRKLFLSKKRLETRFLEQLQRVTSPIVEDETTAIFLVHGRYKQVRIAGDFNGWQPDDTLIRIKGTHLWFKRMTFPPTARLDYKIVVDGKWIEDPLNPSTIRGGFGDNNELVMPGYDPPIELADHPSVPLGTVESMVIPSTVSGRSRRIAVYLPPEYTLTDQPYPVIYVHDGIEFITIASMHRVLDYLIHRELIRPMVAVFVEPIDRMKEYWDNESFVDSFAKIIVPFIRARVNVSHKSADNGVMGASLGGLMALKMAYHHSEIWGNAAGLSSAIQIEESAFTKSMLEGERKNLRIYLDCGTFERMKSERDFFEMNKSFANALAVKGYPVMWKEHHEGHSWGNWRANVSNVLKFFFPFQSPDTSTS
jgi:enterochelin esterase-like enzyme